MAMPARTTGQDAPQGGRIIAVADWPYQRFAWLSAVRRDVTLNPMARLVAHELALGFANHTTMRCDPSMRQLAEALGTSPDTVKRAVYALIDGGWITRTIGDGRGRKSAYLFLSRGEVVALKGGKSAPLKGGTDAPLSGEQRGADLRGKGGKSAPRYNIAKPYKNHDGARADENVSETVARWAAMIRAGDGSTARYLTDFDIRQMLRFEMVTKDQLRRCGIDVD